MNWAQAVYDWFAAALERMLRFGIDVWNAFIEMLEVLISYIWMNITLLFSEIICFTIQTAVAVIELLPVNTEQFAEHIVVGGQVLFVMNVYMPVEETFFMFLGYWTIAGAVYVTRHVIKLIPFVG